MLIASFNDPGQARLGAAFIVIFLQAVALATFGLGCLFGLLTRSSSPPSQRVTKRIIGLLALYAIVSFLCLVNGALIICLPLILLPIGDHYAVVWKSATRRVRSWLMFGLLLLPVLTALATYGYFVEIDSRQRLLEGSAMSSARRV